MKILGVYNIKGGVGKTATAINVAWLAAQEGRRTLVWDLDPQGAASFYFRIKPKIKIGAKGLIKGKRELDDMVKGTDFDNLDLLPADFSYRHMDLLLDDRNKPTKRLQRLLQPLSGEYDLIVLDCPPSISLVSENIFHAADLLMVPMIPTTLSVRTLHQLDDFLKDKNWLYQLKLLPFFSMADRRKSMHKEIMSGLAESYPDLLDVYIPYASDVERMGVHRAPLGSYAPNSPAGKAYQGLWEKVREFL